jgi:hypothetical protein
MNRWKPAAWLLLILTPILSGAAKDKLSSDLKSLIPSGEIEVLGSNALEGSSTAPGSESLRINILGER